jgi:hypothetical protein
MIGIVLTILFAYYTFEFSRSRIHRSLNSKSEAISNQIYQKLSSLNATLSNLQALYHSSRYVDPDQFRIFIQQTLESFPYLKTASWHPRIDHKFLRDFIWEMEDQGFIGFKIKGHGGQESSQTHYFPAVNIEPYNEIGYKYLGWDLLASPAYSDLVHTAAKTGQPILNSLGFYSDDAVTMVSGIAAYEGKSVPQEKN